MQGILSTSQAFQSDQEHETEITYYDTPFTVLENGVASGGIRFDLINPVTNAPWTIRGWIETASTNTDISQSFKAVDSSFVTTSDGRVPSVIDYWAGGSPAHLGGNYNGRVALHYWGQLRSALGRAWFDANEIPTWHLAIAGSGWIRIDKHVGNTVTTIFNQLVSESDFVLNGFAFSTGIADLEDDPTHSLHIYYVQGDVEPWGGLVVKAVNGAAPAYRKLGQQAAREAPVLSAGIIDDAITSKLPGNVLSYTGTVDVQHRRGQASTATFTVPLINMASTDGVGWEYKRDLDPAAGDPGTLRFWNGVWTDGIPAPVFEMKHQRLVRIRTGFKGESLTTVFVGLLDDFDDFTSGSARVVCTSFTDRLIDRHDKNYPDKISYMARGYNRLTGTSQPAYDTPAFDNWPMEHAVSELMIRMGIDSSRLYQPLMISRFDKTDIPAVIGTDEFRKFRGRIFNSKHLKLERATHYGNNGIVFNEDVAVDEEYVFKPENTLEGWKRVQDMTDRYGYDCYFDELGDAVLQPQNNPHAVYNVDTTDATSGTLTKDIHPSAHEGNYCISSGAITIRKAVTGARIDVCLPRAPGLGAVTVNIYRAADLNSIIRTVTLTTALSEYVYFYDYRATIAGTNATISTVYSGEFDNYVVEFVGAADGKNRRFDCVFTYHTDPSLPKLPVVLSTQKNALSMDTRGSMEEMRNSVTVVGRKKATLTDSEKLELNPNNPESEFVVARAVDVESITKPGAKNYIGYPRETLIYSKDITDQDFAEYLARVMIYRYNVPLPSAPIKHTLLPCIQLRDPVYAQETRYNSIPAGQPLYVTGYTHHISKDGATTEIETSAFPEFPAYEPRQDIDIDQAEFGGYPVMNVDVSYTSLTNHTKRNLKMYTPGDNSVIYLHDFDDVVKITGVSTSGNQLDLSGKPWPPVPGTFFIEPVMADSAYTTITSSAEKVAVGGQFPTPFPLRSFQNIKKVTVTRYTYGSIYDSWGTPDAPTEVFTDPQLNKYGFFYQIDPTTNQLTIRRASVLNGADSSTTLNFVAIVEYYTGVMGSDSGVVTNNPYHHLFDIDYRSGNRVVRLGWHQADDTSDYQLPSSLSTCTVRYRQLGPVGAGNFFDNPYAFTGSPFYDPYTSELGYMCTVKFDALVSGLYRVSVRSATTKEVVAWLTEPTADPAKDTLHWTYLGAGVDKEFVWDGVDNVGAWNTRQSQPYAAAATGEFEQGSTPTIGKGFYVWNEERKGGADGQLALISGDFQNGTTHPVTTQLGAPVFGVGTFGAWYIQIEAVSDYLKEVEEENPNDATKKLPRLLKTLDPPKTTLPRLYSGGETQAIIYTHLPRPTGIDLEIADWTGAMAFDDADQTDIDDNGNWYQSIEASNSTTADSEGVINNDKPVRIRFTAQPRPGILWYNKQNEVSLKLSRSVHLRAHIFDQFITFDGNNFAGTTIPNRTIVSRRLVNDSHTLRFDDSGYRKAKDFKPVTAEGTEWIFQPKDFKKNFRGIDNEPLVFGDYLQLEEVPKWDDNRQIAGARSRLQIAFMNYLFYLSAYVQDRSGRFSWGTNRRFIDKSKIITNDPSHWWNPESPGSAANSSTYKVPLPDDPMRLHRRTIVARQWSDELAEEGGQAWKEREASKWGFSGGSIGDLLLRHKWKDHDPSSVMINGSTWYSLHLYDDKYSRYARDRSGAPSNQKLTGSGETGLSYGEYVLARQLGEHGTGTTKLGTWSWEDEPLWIPCITRDFHPYFLVPPMADPAYPRNEMQKYYLYGQVSQDTYNNSSGANKGDDVAQGSVWNSATHEMTVPYTSASGGKTHLYAGTKVQLGTNPTKNLTDLGTTICDYMRQDETVHYEDLRGIYSRGPRPTEAPKKVTPVQPYYVNPMAYDSFVYDKAFRNESYPLYKVKITNWFDMKFRAEYFWENGAWFPVDNYGREYLGAMNYTLTRFDAGTGRAVKYDSGAWTGWKDDLNAQSGDTEFYVHASVPEPNPDDLLTYGIQPVASTVFSNKALVVGVGPKVPESRDMLFHLVLVNERRETPAAEN